MRKTHSSKGNLGISRRLIGETGNDVYGQGAIALSEALKMNSILTTLDLTSISITIILESN